MEIVGFIQNYEWGKVGHDSLVAQLHSNNINYEVNSDTPYAELWMGIHNKGQSLVKDNFQPLSEFLGNVKGRKIKQCLPFLFKVLSVNKALSIQCHPNKEQAESMHQSMPKIYTDDNHKPEMAIALTDFRVLCGIRPPEEIKYFLENIPEFKKLFTDEALNNYLKDHNKKSLQDLFLCWLNKEENELKIIINDFITRLKKEDEVLKAKYLLEIVEQLQEWYPNDVGVFAPFFFNYFTLKPGECLFIDAGVPHAYVKGDCVECMAVSDNVVRCGLTPKYKDIGMLMEVMDYKSYSVNEIKCKGITERPNVLAFNPPGQEFGLSIVTLKTAETHKITSRETGSIFIVTSGEGEVVVSNEKNKLKIGSIIFLLPNDEANVKCTNEGPLMFYLAYGIK